MTYSRVPLGLHEAILDPLKGVGLLVQPDPANDVPSLDWLRPGMFSARRRPTSGAPAPSGARLVSARGRLQP